MEWNGYKRCLSILFFLPCICIAQNDTKGKNELSASLSYHSFLHYFGRTDSLKSSGGFATIGYRLQNGIYAEGTIIAISNAHTPFSYTGSTIEAGYRFGQSKPISGNVFYTQFLYRNKSELVQSAIKEQTGINAVCNNPYINLHAGADLKCSSQIDIGANFGINHLFLLKSPGSKISFAVAPAAYLYAGTQNFTNSYLQEKNLPGIPILPQEFTQNVSAFNILAYEFSAPLVWMYGRFNLSMTPAYVVPQHLAMVTGHRELSVQGENRFYTTVSVGIKL